MEAGEYGLTRGTCLVARRLEVVAVAGLLWISWCVLDAAGLRVFFRFFFFESTRPAASMSSPCLIYLSTSKVRAGGFTQSLGLSRRRHDGPVMILVYQVCRLVCR